jgi:hypothetical protein
MLIGERFVNNIGDLITLINQYKNEIGYKPDYIVLSNKTLLIMCNGLGNDSFENKIENIRYEIDNHITEGFVVLCEM